MRKKGLENRSVVTKQYGTTIKLKCNLESKWDILLQTILLTSVDTNKPDEEFPITG